MKHKQPPKGLTEKQRAFCREYVMEWNGTKAYMKVYGVKERVARSCATKLLTNAYIKSYCDEIVKDLEKLCKVSKQRNIAELAKLCYSSAAEIYNDWIELKVFNEIPKDIRDCIESIDTKTEQKNNGTDDKPDWVEVKYVKIRFYSKIESIKELAKEMGWHAAEKIEHSGKIAFEEIPIINLKRKSDGKNNS